MEKTKYGYRIELPVAQEEALERVQKALKEEGFGVLTEIDVKETLKEKLDVEFRPYRILGACNPPLAHKALQAEDDIGLLLPCNVIVYQSTADSTRVVAIDPVAAMAIANNSAVEPVAKDVGQRLIRVLKALEATYEKTTG